jgi:large subunit ribosomal protein L32
MAVPKSKISKARKGTRSSANFKAVTNPMTDCPQCHAVRKPHTVCGNCGYYKGIQRIETRADRKQRKSSASASA